MRPTSVPCPVPSTSDSQHGSSWLRGTRGIETLLLLCTVFSLGCDVSAESQQRQELASQQRALGTGTGLRARYYDNSNLTGLKLSRTEGPVNFTWGTGSPDPSIAADTFSARWSGSVEPLYSETYTFHTVSDDGVRLWVNGVLLIDDWTTHTATERSGTITLTAGQRYAIQLDYFENGSTTTAKLSWSSPSQVKELIPASQLHDVPVEGAAPQLAGTFSAPASGATGQALNISWMVTNLGGGAAQPSWYDAVYLSADAAVGGDTLLTSPMPAQTAALAAGASYTVSRSVTLPRIAPGSYHLIFKTDVEDYLHETDEADNTVIVPLTVLAADLVPTALTAPARAANGERVTVSWTVQNKGPVTANGQWYTSGTDSYRSSDKVFISADPTWDAADAVVGEVLRVNAPTASGASYTLQTNAHIPKVYAEGPAWLLVVTDANGDIVEESDANNAYAVPITIDRPDLVATAFTAPAEAAPGELLSLSWTARNDGTGTAHGQLYTSGTDSYRWHDRVYLSADAAWDAADTLVGEVVRVNAPVAAGASYTTTAKFQLPAAANGSWFLLAIVDKVGDINEQSETNNTFAVPLTIGRADFVVEAFTGPATAANGERVALSWTVRNTGTHLAHGKLYTSGTDSYRWHDRVYLSVDATWDAADPLVGEVVRVNAPLAAGATYTTNATMQLPKVYAEGATHLIVVADKLGDVSELREDDNAFVIPLTVLRSDLVAESFTAPAEAAPGELIPVSWTARNIGTGTAHGPLYTSGTDSYRWYDKVYLSVDASLDSGDIYVGEVSRINAPVVAGAGYTVSPTMQIPVVASGPWYLIAAIDRNGDINEQSEVNNTFAVPITIGRADLTVESLTGPATAANGERVTLSWTVRNAGTNTASGKLYTSGSDSYRWYDRVYVSTDAVWDLTDIYIGEVARANAALPIGASYAVTATFQLPKVYAEGTTHLIVVTDKNGDVSEQNENNNTFTLPLTVLRSDLVAEAFTAPAEAAPGEIVTLTSTVRNAGTGTAHGQLYTSGSDSYRWYDRVYLSTDGLWDAADIYVGETVRSNAPLAAGASYSATAKMQLPSSLANGAWTLIFVTDKSGDVNEQSEGNNTFTVPITIGRSDLVVDAFTGPAKAANGERVALSWSVRNAGINTASGKLYTSGSDSYRWYDKVYLSTDAVWDATDTLLGEVARANAPLSASATYTATATVQLPEVYAEGNAHLILITDKNGDVSEQLEDNNTSVIALTVTRPDLALTAFTAPEASAPGELVTFSWGARNAGTGTATGQLYTSGSDSYRWYDKVYLSADPVLDAADTLLGEVARANAPLATAATYSVNVTFQLPTATVPGNYYFLAAIDRNGDVNELDEANNVSTPVPVSITRADLLAEAFSAPTQASTGQPIALSWTVRNAGTGKANGRWYTSGSDSYRWYDKVYLSTDALLDASDPLVGEVARSSAPLAPGGTYTATASLAIPPAAAGSYFLLLKADANGDVSEDNEDNNVLAASAPISLSAPDLTPVALTGPDSSLTQVPVTLSWTVYNAGAGIAVPDWKDDLYLSMDGACCGDANDVKVTSVTRTPDLAAGASYTVSATVELPKVPAGAYQLVLRTRSGTTMYDADGSNDSMSRPIIIHETTEEPIVSLDGLAGASLKSPRFSPDGNRLAIADGTKARVFELVTFTERGVFAGHSANLDTVSFSPTGDQVLSSAQDGTARSWDSLTFAPVMGFVSTVGRNPAAWSVDGARVLVGNGLKPKLFDSVTGELLQTFSGPTSTVTSVALSPDGALAAAAGADKTARLWNTVTGALVRTLSGHTAQVNALAFSPDGEELLTASDDGTIRFWSVATGTELGRINQGSKVGDASWSSDGKYVVSCDEGSVQPGLGYLWARPSLAGVRSFYHDHETECLDTTKTCGRANRTPGKMTGIALSPDRTMVVGTQPNGKVRVWPSGLPAITPDTTISLVPGTPAPLTLRANRTYHFRFDAVSEGSVVVTMEGSASPDATFASNAGADPISVQMYAKHGATPSVASHDHSARGYASLIRARLPIVLAKDGTYYVSLSAPFLTAGSITGSIVVEPHTFEVASVSPHRVGNAGTSTFAVKGTGLSDAARVELVTPSGAAVASTRVLQLDADTLGVTFNLAGAQTGGYALRVTDPATGTTRTLPGAVDVRAGTGGQLRAWFEGPTAVRGSTVRPFKLRWKNEGDADLAAPILVLSSSDGQALLDANWVKHNAMQVLASAEGYPGDVLPPGTEGSFVFEHRFPNYTGNTTFQLGLASEDNGPFNWADLKPLLTPEAWASDANWNTLWTESTAALGYTRREVAASFRAANRYSTAPASIEAVMSWALEAKMRQHPLVHGAEAQATASSGTLTALAADEASMTASWTIDDVTLVPHPGRSINPDARTYVLSHGWNSTPQQLTRIGAKIARDYPNANIVYVDWSELAATGLQPDPTRASIRAAQNARTAGIRAARLLRELGIGAGDRITHVTHDHGQFVAEAIALRLEGTHKLLALAPENPVGQGFRRPDYDRAFGDGNAVQFVTHRSIFADDVFPQGQVPRGFANDNPSFGDFMDIIRNNADTIETTVSFYMLLDDFVDAIATGSMSSKLQFRGSLLFFAADMLLCGGNDWCSLGLAVAESVIFMNPTPILLWAVFKVLSMSPEEIRGPAPNGETVSRAAPWNYEVVFWNAANAAGPVQELVVIEYLDENLDWSSVDFGLVEYGGQVVPVPPEVTTNWTFRDVPVNNGCTMTGTAEGELAVDITLDYDPQVGRIEWRLKVVDTALEDFPWDPYAGILPPPDEKVCGRGHVTYTVLPKSDAADGASVSAKAAVIFDTNAANYTNTVTHLIGP